MPLPSRLPKRGEKRLEAVRKFSAAIVFFVSLALFVYVLGLDVGSGTKLAYAVVLLAVSGALIRKAAALEGWFCFILLKSRGALRAVDWALAHVGRAISVLCDVGLVLAFGASSWFAFPQIHTQRRLFVLALLALIAYSALLPFAFVALIEVITIPTSAASPPPPYIAAASFIALVVFGFVGATIMALLTNAAHVILTIAEIATTGVLPQLPAVPGVGPVLPGLTIPLIEGIVALAVLIIIHEGAHGVAARTARIRTRGAGLLTFSFIPIGAFVDIDEAQLDKKNEIDRSRVVVAGSAANIIACVPALAVVALLGAALAAMRAQDFIIEGFWREVNVSGVPLEGARIISIGDVEIVGQKDFVRVAATLKPNQSVAILTDRGLSYVRTDERATLGIKLKTVKEGYEQAFQLTSHLYILFALIAGLNFFIGVINLLPVGIFDGLRLLQIGIKNKALADAISWITIAAFVLNLVPWAWA